MQLSDIEGLLRSHLIEGEVMVEEPTNHRAFGDRMYIITTSGLPVWVYIIEAESLYAIEAEGALEVWGPGVGEPDRTVEAVLGHARRNGAPEPPPDPEVVFADVIAYLRPLLREGESLSTGRDDRSGDPTLVISTAVNHSSISWRNGLLDYTSPYDRAYHHYADEESGFGDLLDLALTEARAAADAEQDYFGNR
jgi:hypothetical protein|nr:MAG TPA: hypothetical protein [Caudoviricetes sp.]